MQQRRLRLGDILDDYCPRERRVTNHAVVAMIDDQVKQTRCTTCDADHEYKAARVPSPRRKKDTGALSEAPGEAPRAAKGDDQMTDDDTLDAGIDAGTGIETDDAPELVETAAADPLMAAGADDSDADEDAGAIGVEDDGPVHRPLIRATLPRPEGQVPEWKEPEFTVRQPGRGGREFDQNRSGHGGQGNGQGQGRPGRNRRPTRAGGAGAGGGGGQPGNASAPLRFGSPRHGGGGNPRQGGAPGQGQGSGRGPGGHSGGARGAARSDQRGPGRKRGR